MLCDSILDLLLEAEEADDLDPGELGRPWSPEEQRQYELMQAQAEAERAQREREEAASPDTSPERLADILHHSTSLTALRNAVYNRRSPLHAVLSALNRMEWNRPADFKLPRRVQHALGYTERLNLMRKARQYLHAHPSDRVEIVQRSYQKPRWEGESYYWTTPGGTRINYPNAYNWPKEYHPSTRRIVVGSEWLKAPFRRYDVDD